MNNPPFHEYSGFGDPNSLIAQQTITLQPLPQEVEESDDATVIIPNLQDVNPSLIQEDDFDIFGNDSEDENDAINIPNINTHLRDVQDLQDVQDAEEVDDVEEVQDVLNHLREVPQPGDEGWKGATPLHILCHKSQWKNVNVYLSSSTKLRESIFKQDQDGLLPLHYALAWNCPLDVVSNFLKKGEEFNRKEEENTLPVQQLAVKTRLDFLPLHIASAATNRVEVIRLIVDEYPDALLVKTKWGFLACEGVKYNENANRDIIAKLLLEETDKLRLIRRTQELQIQLKLSISHKKKYHDWTSLINNGGEINALDTELFIFKVLEEMISREMYGLAETIVSYVGAG